TADAKGVEFVAALGASARMKGDPDRLQQVIWNLLSNAVKFTPKGGRVEVRVLSEEGKLRIVVKDSGEGMPSEFLPRIFERFSQADTSMTRKHGGLGLGLSIVRHLVELHGGSILAESRGEGYGATFTVEFPVPAAALIEEHPTAASAGVPS